MNTLFSFIFFLFQSGAQAQAAAVVPTPISLPPENQQPAKTAEPPFDTNSSPLLNRHFGLLFINRYSIKPDGTIWGPDAAGPVAKSEMPFLLDRLEGAQRLKALIAIRMIFNRTQEGAAMTPADAQTLRTLLRDNWAVFSYQMRKDFKKYFTPQELEAMDGALETPVPLPNQLQDFKTEDILPKVLQPLRITQAEPIVSTAAAALEEEPIQTPAVSTTSYVVEAEIPLPLPATPAPLPEALPAAAIAEIEAASRTPVAVVSEPIPAQTPQAPAPPHDFSKFLPDAPYGREVKNLLTLLHKHAPDFVRLPILTLVASSLPPIVLDASRTEMSLRGELLPDSTIALSPGALIFERKKMFFGRSEILLSNSPKSYATLDLAAPQALDPERAPASRKGSDWGETKYYPDGTARGTFSPEQQAGTLLNKLVLLNLRTRRPQTPPYLAELYARTAQWIFYARLKEELNGDHFLDPELRVELRQWLDQPDEARDHFIHVFFAGHPAGAAVEVRTSDLTEELASAEIKFRRDREHEQAK